MKRIIGVLIATIVVVIVLAVDAVHAGEPFNKVVILVDDSGSFASRAPQAVQQVQTLLDEYLARKQRRSSAHRKNDEITVVSIDASPDIIYAGSFEEMRKLDRKEWITRFNARKSFGFCTDVVGAFDRAVKILTKGDPADGNYIFAFSDLIDEPVAAVPDNRTRMSCKPARREPAADFPWKALADMQVQTSLAWLPTDQAVRWLKAINEQGLSDTVKVLSDAEASALKLTPPPKAHKVQTQAEKEATKAQVEEGIRKTGEIIGNGLLFLVLGIAGLVIAIVAALHFGRRRRPPSAPTSGPPVAFAAAGQAPRPVIGAVAPLVLPRR